MDLETCKNLLIQTARRCSAQGLQSGNGGNLSILFDSRTMLVKATDSSFSTCTPEDFVLTDLDGNLLDGKKKPSKECKIHGFLYRVRPDIKAVVHCHSPWAVSWAASGQSLPEATYHSVLKLKGYVPVFDSKSYVIPESYFHHVLELFQEQPGIMAFLFKGHGQFALGKDLEEARNLSELVEETAHIALFSRLLAAVH